ncbi:MBL fold metallo-hydrolase [Evtepia sp.]|uniref:MBL fold metallo-hydrolase n=1 Tax=Evtepia sp. TaxID=2773933 RepID=UPI003F17CCE8
MLQIKRMQVGQIGTNCYLLEDPDAKLCAVIDPGDNADGIDREIRKAGLSLSMILITHGHFDHVLAVPGLLAKWPDIPVYVHKQEVNWEGKGDQYMLLGPVPNIKTVGEGDVIDFSGHPIQVLHTPGHSPGSVCYLVGDILFAGDTLFAGSCGRTDFIGGSVSQILMSLKRLAGLEGNLRVCPGHDRLTSLDAERASNPFVLQALR